MKLKLEAPDVGLGPTPPAQFLLGCSRDWNQEGQCDLYFQPMKFEDKIPY